MQKVGYRPNEAANFFGSVQLLRRFVAAGWLKATVQSKSLTLYDAGDMARCWAKLRAKESLPMLERTSK